MPLPPVGAAPLPAPGAATAPRAPFPAAEPRAAAPSASVSASASAPMPSHAPSNAVRSRCAGTRPFPAAEPRSGVGAPWGAALAPIERAQARLDQVLAQARAGRTFTAAELLALQAEAYRCAQVVDLGAKLAEQGAQAVKQALNTQL